MGGGVRKSPAKWPLFSYQNQVHSEQTQSCFFGSYVADPPSCEDLPCGRLFLVLSWGWFPASPQPPTPWGHECLYLVYLVIFLYVSPIATLPVAPHPSHTLSFFPVWVPSTCCSWPSLQHCSPHLASACFPPGPGVARPHQPSQSGYFLDSSRCPCPLALLLKHPGPFPRPIIPAGLAYLDTRGQVFASLNSFHLSQQL